MSEQLGIVEALKSEFDMRLSHDDRWLIWVNANSMWEVWQHKYGARKTTILICTESETEAVRVLLGEK